MEKIAVTFADTLGAESQAVVSEDGVARTA